MKYNIYLKPSLSLLWILTASYCAAYKKVLKVNLTIYYHEAPRVAYRGSPVQGVCSAPMVGNDFLCLTALWKSNSNMAIYMLQWDNMRVSHAMGGLIVNKVKDAMNTGFVFKFCLREPIQFQCLLHRGLPPNRKQAFDYAIITPSSFIRPRKPFIVEFYHLKPKLLIEGETVTVACRAIVGTGGKMLIAWYGINVRQAQNWTIPFEGKATSKGYRHPINLTVHREMTDEGPRITAWLRIPVTKSWEGRTLVCVSSSRSGDQQEKATKPRSNVTSLPFKPRLRIDSVRPPFSTVLTLEAYCSSTDPTITGLSLTLRTADQTTVFTEMQDARGIKSYKKKHFPNKHYTGPRSFINVFFWTETGSNALRLGMGAVVNASSEPVVVTCRLNNVQVCRHYKQVVTQGVLKQPDEYLTKTHVSITIVVTLILGLVACLLLVIMMQRSMSSLVLFIFSLE